MFFTKLVQIFGAFWGTLEKSLKLFERTYVDQQGWLINYFYLNLTMQQKCLSEFAVFDTTVSASLTCAVCTIKATETGNSDANTKSSFKTWKNQSHVL